MKRTDLKYIERKTVKGRDYVYFRKGRLRIRLPTDMDSEEFFREYWSIRNGKRNTPTKTSWNELIISYYKGPAFKSLAKGTQQNYRRDCEAIREKNGTKDVRLFKRKHAIAARDALQSTWSRANHRIAVLSILCKHAVDLEWIDRNPVVDIPKLKGGEYEPWPATKLRAFEKVANATARTAYELGVGTGQRIGDCCGMLWDDFDGEFMHVVQEKTGTKIWIYCPKRLQDYLGKIPRNGRHILAKNISQPIGKRAVQKAIEDGRREIDVLHGENRLVPHGWRYNAAIELAEAGCSDAEIQAVTGHLSLEMVQKYRKRAGQKAASKRAQERRE